MWAPMIALEGLYGVWPAQTGDVAGCDGRERCGLWPGSVGAGSDEQMGFRSGFLEILQVCS